LTGVKEDGTKLTTSGKVTYTFPNIFVEEPTQSCPDREMKEDPKISVQITQPNGGDIGREFSLSFNAEGPKNLRRLAVLIDDELVASFDYVGKTKTMSKTETVKI